ncbi:PD-(D/E)XK nuclease family protein [bacterium]|nr:PD-(D/E)XK nuclease family protein [bacterium]
MSELTRLSASRISCAEKCSWVYWSKYREKVPDSSNTGASRGSVCHNIFEFLGKNRHKKHWKNILKHNSIKGSKAVDKLVKIQASKQDPPVDSQVELDLIDEFIVNGLNFDFYGDSKEKTFDSISEKVFELKVNEKDKKYYIYGFIDKLFLYDKGKRAVIRDFKTSKKVYVGSEITDNLQNLIYCLAVSKLYPKCKDITTEFLFLKFDLNSDLLGNQGEGVLKMDRISKEELEGFEYHLTEIQSYLDNFDYDTACSNFAADQPFPQDKSFSGPLSCGFAKEPGQLKKDGTPMWHCNYKFPFYYHALKDKSGAILKSVKDGEEFKLIADESEGQYIEKMHYEGCPKFNVKNNDLDL